MRKFSATDAALAGFRFVRENPRVAATWSAIALVVSLVFSAVMVAMAGPALMRLQTMQGQHPDPATAMTALRDLAPFYAIAALSAAVFYPVLYAAMNRAVLRPARAGFAYLRFGADELRQLGLLVLAGLFGLALYIGVWVVVAVVAIAAGLALGKSAAAFAIVALVLVAGLCALAYVVVRLSLASALSFDTGRLNLFGSWTLTKGQFWPLLGCYLLVLGLVVAIGLLFLIIEAALAMVIGGVGGMSILVRPDMSSLGAYFSPARVVLSAIGAISSGVVLPVLLMPHPTIYALLRDRR